MGAIVWLVGLYQDAIYCASGYGPTFGGGVRIKNNPNTTMNGYSELDLGTYSHPQYEEGTIEARTFLAGSYEFQLDEIEVYEKD